MKHSGSSSKSYRRRRRRKFDAPDPPFAGPVRVYFDPSVVRRAEQPDERDDRAVEAKAE